MMGAEVCLLFVAGAGAAGVVGLAGLLRLFRRFRRLRTGTVLAISHSAIVCGFLALSPLYIAAERATDSPYGDVYLPYLLVPGFHIYHPVSVFFGRTVFPLLLGHMESFPASVICIVAGPGLAGLLAGALQWYVIGRVWEWVGGWWAGAEPPDAAGRVGS